MARSGRVCRKNVYKEKGFVIALVLLTAFGLIFALFSPSIERAAAYNRSSAVVLMNAEDGSLLYSENPDDKLEIASTTKILTALCVIENNDVFSFCEIPPEAVGVEGSSIYLRNGEKWRVLDLLYGLMLRSGNDAATALAILTSGSVEKFTVLMNETARKLGAKKSSFVNPHGLHDEKHYSTARDMATITRYALKCPIFAAICKTKKHSFSYENSSGERVKGVFYNKNKLLYSYEYATGVKTGYTKHSGRCLISSASKNGVDLVCVVLNVYDTYGVTKSLFEKYFDESPAQSDLDQNA